MGLLTRRTGSNALFMLAPLLLTPSYAMIFPWLLIPAARPQKRTGES
jgi:hypothetical protein